MVCYNNRPEYYRGWRSDRRTWGIDRRFSPHSNVYRRLSSEWRSFALDETYLSIFLVYNLDENYSRFRAASSPGSRRNTMRCTPKRMSVWCLSKFFDSRFGGDEGRDVVLEVEPPSAAASARSDTFKPWSLSILVLVSRHFATSKKCSTFSTHIIHT